MEEESLLLPKAPTHAWDPTPLLKNFPSVPIPPLFSTTNFSLTPDLISIYASFILKESNPLASSYCPISSFSSGNLLKSHHSLLFTLSHLLISLRVIEMARIKVTNALPVAKTFGCYF